MCKHQQALAFFWGVLFCCAALQVSAQTDYSNYRTFSKRLQTLQRKHTSESSLKLLTTTVGGHKIWGLTLAKGNAQDKPAIAMVSGVDGTHILGPEMAFQIAENILKNHSEILEKTTFYIFPNMSPNATEQYFSSVKYAVLGNARKTDDDRDGLTNEDGFDDLNKDGLISMMRIEDPTGGYTLHKQDSRVVIKADKNKGQLGNYHLISEGIDNDKDGKFNEDGKGGIQFNKNFSYNYPYFTPGAGEHPISEKENRALLSFLYEHWNIYAVITFGPENNLSAPLKYNTQGAKKRVVTSILKKDASLNKFLSERYTKITETSKTPSLNGKGGDFFQWSYFHFGRLALSTPGWWVPTVQDSITKASKNKHVNYLRWAAKENIPNAFVDWTSVQHPDFPNRKVEIGGIPPHKMSTPPHRMVADISKKHTDFILELATMQANIELQNIKVEAVGKGFTRITADVYNSGILPTHTEMGARSRWLRKIKVALKLTKQQELISGKKITLVSNIEGDRSQQFTWLIKGKGNVVLEAGTSHTGKDKEIINLK